MKAIVVSAGQGSRLLPLTQTLPKCLLPIAGELSILDVQLETLARCGVREATIMVGFGAEQVERRVRERSIPGLDVRLMFNPLHSHSDNLVTVWLASTCVDSDYVLLNGDTLFEPAILRRALEKRDSVVSAVVNRKDAYDADDMCVWIEDTSLSGIGKGRREAAPDGEAIGLYVFRGRGVGAFRGALEAAVARPEGLRSWYPPVLEELAQRERIDPVWVEDLWWTEIDVLEDLEKARVGIGSHHLELATSGGEG